MSTWTIAAIINMELSLSVWKVSRRQSTSDQSSPLAQTKRCGSGHQREVKTMSGINATGIA